MSIRMNQTCCTNDHDLTFATPMMSWSARARRAAPSLVAAFDIVFLWRERIHQRRMLMTLDQRLLQDIGIDQAAAAAEYRKPFWRP